MAKRTWVGGTTAVAQVDIITAGATWETNDVATITLTGEDGTTSSLDTVSGSATISTIMTTVTAAFNASVHPFFTPITASAGATTVTLTADTAGIPFYATATTTENGGGGSDSQTFVRAASVTNKGPNDWNTPGNWVEGSVPVALDDVTITGSNAIKYGLVQTAVVTGGFLVSPGCSAAIGLPGKKLKMAPSSFEHHGTGQAYYDISAAAISPRFVNTASSGTGQYGAHIIGSAMTIVRVEGGGVAVALYPGETATATTIQTSGNGRAAAGSGTTLTNFKMDGGTGLALCAGTTATINSGAFTTGGTGAWTTLTAAGAGASIVSNSSRNRYGVRWVHRLHADADGANGIGFDALGYGFDRYW
jgi:hypothetical protein